MDKIRLCDEISIVNVKRETMGMKKFLHEFQSTGWSSGGFRRILRHMMKEGSADINYKLHNAVLQVTHYY